MGRKFTILLSLFLIFLTCQESCVFASQEEDIKTVAENNQQFAFDLYSQIKNNDDNLFFSPFSISMALAMTYAGARGNTEKQMAETLHFSLNQDELHPIFLKINRDLQADQGEKGFELSIANALWGEKSFKFHKSFIDLTKNYYEAGFKEADFKNNAEPERQTINSWVEKQTKDKIKDLLLPRVLTEITKLVLVNAIYFKGHWIYPFEKEYTQPRKFELISGEQIEVPTMNQESSYGYSENETLQILEMPYKGDELSMVIFLPKKAGGIKELEASLKTENVRNWLSKLEKQEVTVFLPKFTMTREFSLKENFESLGMTDAFNPYAADFSGMSPLALDTEYHLCISEIIHKAFVDVNEEGTEAAAATAVVMVKMTAAAVEPKPIFNADHPFIFIIRDKISDNILFIGRVMDPLK
ncbi:MAG: serpin family protein [Candidatus Omnitrophica bacterium]|nr:serpin family protein [Candidatus Omnitrophota bacterium]